MVYKIIVHGNKRDAFLHNDVDDSVIELGLQALLLHKIHCELSPINAEAKPFKSFSAKKRIEKRYPAYKIHRIMTGRSHQSFFFFPFLKIYAQNECFPLVN